MRVRKFDGAATRRALYAGAALALALSPQAAEAQQAFDITYSGSGVSGTALVTTNGTGANGYVANFIVGSLTDTVNGAGTITGLSQTFAGPDNNIQATSPYVDFNGLSFNANNATSYNIFSQSGLYAIETTQTGSAVNSGTLTVAVHPSIDTQQASYDQTGTPLTQSTVVFAGGTFKPTATYVLGAPIILSSQGGSVDSTNGDIYLSGNLAGPGGLTIAGTANGVELQGANTYTGGTTINSGAILAVTTTAALPGDVLDNGYLQFLNSAAGTYSGAITGAGGVEGFGSGSLTLTANSTTTGSLFVGNGSTVQIGAGGTSGAWAGNIGDGGSLVFNNTGAVTFSGSIGDYLGAGAVTVAGGTLTLTGVSSYTGLTTVNSGATLALAGAGSIASSSDPVVNGTFDISQTTNGASVASLSGSGSVLLGGQTLTLTAAADTFSGVIADGGAGGGTGGGLTIAAGTETLTGANSYTGATSISSGATLALSGTGSIATSSGVAANGTLDISATTAGASIASLSGGASGSVALGSQTLTLTDASGAFAGGVTGSGSVVITGGTESFSGTLTNGGPGAAVVLAGTQSGLVNSGTINGSGLAIATTGVAASVVNTSTGSIQGGISLNQSGAFTLDNAGTIGGGVGGTAASITLVNRAGGVINQDGVYVEGPQVTIVNAGYVTGAASALGTNAGVGTGVSTVINAAGGQLVAGLSSAYGGHYDNAIQVWGATSTFSNFGTALGGADQGGAGVAVNLANGGSATVNLFAGSTTGAVVAEYGPTTINLYTGTGSGFAGLTYDLTTGNVLSGNQSDADHIVLQAAGANAAAVFGAIDLGSAPSGTINLRGQGDGTAANGAAATLALDQVANLSILQKLDTGTWTLTGASASPGATVYAGDGTPSGVLNFAGSGLTGDIYVNGATIVAQANGAFGTGTIHAIDPTIEYAATGTFANNISLETTAASAPTSLTVDAGVTATLTGAIYNGAGAGVLANQAVVFNGAGVAVLTGTNTYTGTTAIDAGATVALSGAGSIAQSSGVAANGTFDISGTTAGASITSLAGSGQVNLGGQTLTLTSAGDLFTGVIADGGLSGGTGGSLTIAGGTETLTGSNSFTGQTTITSGATLALAGSGAIAQSSGVVANGSFDISDTTAGASITSLSGSGQVNLGGQTLTLTGAGDTFSGVIADGGVGGGTGGSLTIAGGTETLTGTNTYTGATTINGGATLRLGDGGATGSVAGAIIDNGLVQFNHSGQQTFGAGLSGSGSVEVVAGDLVVTQLSRVGGAVTIDNGATLEWGNGSVDGWLHGGGLTTVDNGTLVINAADSYGGGFSISGSGALVVEHGNFYVVGGALSYTGATTIDANAALHLLLASSIASSSGVVADGTLDLSGVTSGPSITTLSGSGSVFLGSNILTLTNASGTFSGSIGDGGGNGGSGGGLTIASGTETLTGGNTYTGATTVDVGATLVLAGSGAVAQSSGVVANGVFDISGTSSGASIASLSGPGQVNLGGQTLTLSSAGGTFSGVISDGGLGGGTGGSLTIAGGAEILTGTNTFTGLTTISAGAALQLGNGGLLGSVAGNIVDNGALTFDYQTYVTYGGMISGAGSVTLAPTGWGVYFTGNNTYTGLTSVGAGTALFLGNGGTSGSIAGNVLLNGGDLVFDRSDNVVFSGTISGTGWITLSGGDTVTLTANNTFTGSPNILPGSTLQLGNGGTTGSVASAQINDYGAVVFDRSNAVAWAGVIQQSGSVTIGGTGTVNFTNANTYSGGTSINAGATLMLGSGGTSGSIQGGVVDNGTLAFNRADVVTFAGVISGSGALTQAGTGTTILNGDDTVSGLTTVSAGVLEVGDEGHAGAVLDSHIGGVVVGAAGTLSGHGAILGAVTNTAGGTVAPGGTIGTLTVGGYTQGAGSTLAIEVSPTAASRLNVVGAASLNGRLALAFDPGHYAPRVYEILAGAPVSGTFSSVTSSGTLGGGLGYTLDYTPTQVDLVLETTSPAQVYGGVSSATLDRAQGFAGLVEDRFGDAGCANGTTGKPASACDGMGAWAQAIANTDRVGSSASGFGFTSSGSGVIGGLDRRWANGATTGAAFGYDQEDLSMGGASAKASGASYYGALYGRWVVGRAWLDGQAFYMHSDWTVNRRVAGEGATTSSPGGNTEGFLVQASVPLARGDLRPYARVTYADFGRGAVQESGLSGWGYTVASAQTTSILGEVGLLLGHSFAGEGGREIRPALQIGVQQELGDRSRDVSASATGLSGSGFALSSAAAPGVAGVVDASLKVVLSRRFELTTDLRGRFSGAATDASASLGGVFRF
jgi:autotransporter-associated beta strand protein